ncbi:MAG: SUMF1/EgtB/PvdO family nonheme iron enzyme [Rhodospirillales bacterium]|nr:SUMF1/EgtB/PvdO family nonheme iron enzyme [Rhodospirillales bacterium]
MEDGEARNDLRRRAPLKGFSPQAPVLVHRLVDARLLVTGRYGGSGEEVVEVAHEALLRLWPNLGQWIDLRRGALLTIRQLQADARTWLSKNENRSYLWSHERVREAAAALRQCPEERLTPEQQKFLGPILPERMIEDLKDPRTDHHQRRLIGERLDVFGDPRKGVEPDANGVPEIDWCDVAAGEVDVQTKRRLLPGTRLRRKRVERFRIARYPVTVAQYRAFLEAEDGWSNPRWWGDNDLYRDPDGKTYDVGRFGNHPAVYVNWFDAVAFCRWLGGRLQADLRLPDEWEWQQAATGGNAAYAFPWGANWDPKAEPQRANTFESRRRPRWACTRMAHRRCRSVRSTWRERSGSGARTSTTSRMSRNLVTTTSLPVCCAAGPGAAAGTTRARPTAAGPTRSSGTSASGFAWCFRRPSSFPDFLAAPRPAAPPAR